MKGDFTEARDELIRRTGDLLNRRRGPYNDTDVSYEEVAEIVDRAIVNVIWERIKLDPTFDR